MNAVGKRSSFHLLTLQMERDTGDDDVWLEQQGALDKERSLVVEQVVPPTGWHELGKHNGDVVLWPRRVQLLDVFQKWFQQRPVRRGQHLKRHPTTPFLPVPSKLLCRSRLDIDVNGAHVRRQRLGV